MVEVRQSTEEMSSAVHLEPNDYPPLPSPLNLKHLNHRPIPRLHVPHHILVYLQRVFRCLLQERLIRHGPNVGFAICTCGLGWVREIAFGDEVATKLLGRIGGD